VHFLDQNITCPNCEGYPCAERLVRSAEKRMAFLEEHKHRFSVRSVSKIFFSRSSSFQKKIISSVSDYGLSYELLLYQYDWWLFRILIGAIDSAQASGCSSATSLEANTFGSGYWRTQQALLIDAVRQFGYPSFFVTISPFNLSRTSCIHCGWKT